MCLVSATRTPLVWCLIFISYELKRNCNTLHQAVEIEEFLETHDYASCVWCSDCAYYCVRVLVKDIGRRLPLELQCRLYQGQQGDVKQPVHGNCRRTRFWKGQNLVAVKFISLLCISLKSYNISVRGGRSFWGGGEGGIPNIFRSHKCISRRGLLHAWC